MPFSYYSSRWWRTFRKRWLLNNPWCVRCAAIGLERHATTVDHVSPHKGNVAKFKSGPFQSLCDQHHNQWKKRIEHRGYDDTIDEAGWPIDPQHPANKGCR